MKKVIILIVSLLLFTNVYAYENEYFSIDIKEPFKGPSITDKKYIFSSGNEYISITITDKKEDYDVGKFTEEDLVKQKNYLEKEYKENFSKYTSNVVISDIQLKDIDTLPYIEYDIYYETKKAIGYDIYQRCRMYTTDNYVYSILYNSDKEITNNDYLDTFKIKDDYLKKVNVKLYIIVLVIILVIILLLDFLFSKKKHKKRR